MSTSEIASYQQQINQKRETLSRLESRWQSQPQASVSGLTQWEHQLTEQSELENKRDGAYRRLMDARFAPGVPSPNYDEDLALALHDDIQWRRRLWELQHQSWADWERRTEVSAAAWSTLSYRMDELQHQILQRQVRLHQHAIEALERERRRTGRRAAAVWHGSLYGLQHAYDRQRSFYRAALRRAHPTSASPDPPKCYARQREIFQRALSAAQPSKAWRDSIYEMQRATSNAWRGKSGFDPRGLARDVEAFRQVLEPPLKRNARSQGTGGMWRWVVGLALALLALALVYALASG